MPEIKNFTGSSIKEAIKKIDNNPELRNGRESTHYDLVYNGSKYPPILVLSEANKLLGGSELTLKDFNNNTDKAFSILEKFDLKIIEKSNNGPSQEEFKTSKSFNPNKNKAWIEKTYLSNQPHRESGEYALGKRLWSPQRDARGADIYKFMREVQPGDYILHLVDNEKIIGVSFVDKPFKEGSSAPNSNDWQGDAYIVDLKGFKKINPIHRDEILDEKNRNILDPIRKNNNVFFNVNLNLREGAYLTQCPFDLLNLINEVYKEQESYNLPYLDESFFSNSIFHDKDIDTLKIQSFKDGLSKAGIIFKDNFITRFITSLSTKPFLILTGLSGSGKTKLAQAFAEWITLDESQFNIVPVGADWTNREPLLGYPNALKDGSYVLPDSGVLQLVLRANENPEIPFFLILDEMNLSHVERYFADFLSAIESEEKIKLHSGSSDWETDGYQIPSTLSIPKNLFIVGTVNIDETTYMFSPKVLDRANVIEFRVSKDELTEFLNHPADVNLKRLSGQGSAMSKNFVELATKPADEYSNKTELSKELIKLFEELSDVGAEFGYRTAYEINRFAGLAEHFNVEWDFEHIMDAAIVQKLLPKLHGSRRKLEDVLLKLGNLCLIEGEAEELFKKPNVINYEMVKYPISFEKLVRMHKGVVQNGFTSFAEA